MIFVEHCNCNLFISPIKKSNTIFCNGICIVELTLIMVEEYQFLTYLVLLRHRFRLINTLLKKNCLQNLLDYCQKVNSAKIYPVEATNCDKGLIVRLRSLHLQLCFAGKLLNEYFSIQILFLVALSFVGFTTNAYYTFDVISDNFANNNSVFPSTFVWTVTRFVELLLISVICTITKNEVSDLYKLYFFIKKQRFR